VSLKDSASKKSLLPAEQDRPKIARKRERWKQLQAKLDPRRLVFIDETWIKTNMVRLRGRAPRGQRLRQKVPHGHWKTMTFIGALRFDRIDAPCVLDQPVNRRSFLQYVKQFLAPTLGTRDVVLMDNLNCHKNREVRRAIRATGSKLWLLPAYSPDLNPIEQVFAKLKQLLRKAAERTFDDVCERVAKLLDEFTPQECANYVRNAGYTGVPGPAVSPVST
jgi:transposase